MSERDQRKPGAAQIGGGEEARETRMRAVLTEAYPAHDPSDALRHRVAALATAHDSETMTTDDRGRSERARERANEGTFIPSLVHSFSRSLGGRWSLLGFSLVGATGLAVALTLLIPFWTAAQFLRRVEAATSQVRSVHVVTWNVDEEGRRTKRSESWEMPGRSRSEDARDGRVSLHADGRFWVYEPQFNKVTVRRMKRTASCESSGYTLTAMRRDFQRWGWRQRVRILGETTVNGRRYLEVMIETPGQRERSKLLVDVATDLPMRMEAQLETDGQWKTRGIHELHYNEPLAPTFFAPSFPKSAPIFDADAGREEWRRRLAGGIARQKARDRTIVIRDLQVNAEGDVFLLYTAGKRPGDARPTGNYIAGRDWNLTLRDEFGTEYLWHGIGLKPVLDRQAPGLPNGYVFGGERLEGDWWTPLEPQRPWQPRRFTLTFDVSPVNVHGKYEDPEAKAKYTEHVRFALPVARPAAMAIPDYMPYMGLGPQEQDLPGDRARVRAFYYRYEKRNLERALALYREIIRLRDERASERNEPIFDSQTWIYLGKTLRDLGRLEEAVAAFEQALREALHADWMRRDAQGWLETTRAELAWRLGRVPPSFALTDLAGQQQSLDRYRGQVLLIAFWGTWDKSAKHDARRLKALYERYHGRGLAILGVCMNLDNYEKPMREFLKEEAIPWPQLWDGKGWLGQAGRHFGVTRSPMTILVDRKGIVRHVGSLGEELAKVVAEGVGE